CGFGRTTGIDLPSEAAGQIPTPESLPGAQQRAWRASDTQAFAIGQSTLTVTPLQVARLLAAVGNGGHLVTPHFVAENESQDPPTSEEIAGLHPETLAAVREGL